MVDPAASARAAYARELAEAVGFRTPGLEAAFAAVPRDAFVGRGPWQVIELELGGEPTRTPDDDPAHLHRNVLVVLDAEREINSGEPRLLAGWLDTLGLAPGRRMLHVGCGVGYYTAVAAQLVGSSGRVLGVEAEPDLASRARNSLAPWPWAEVVEGDASRLGGTRFEAILTNAGVTHVPPVWCDALAEGGRWLLPMTVDLPASKFGAGWSLVIERRPGLRWGAAFQAPVGIFPCLGARDEHAQQALRKAFEAGGHDAVCSLRLDLHDPEPSCWLHGEDGCLSRLPV